MNLVMRTRDSRRRLLSPLLLSVLLHLGLGFWLWERGSHEPPVPSTPEDSRPLSVELDFSEAPAPTAKASPPPASPRPPRPHSVTRVERSAPPPALGQPPPTHAPVVQVPATGAPAPEAPTAEDAPRRAAVLVPSWMKAPPAAGSQAGAPPAHGRTLRPGDPELQPESKQEEAERLTAQVQDWADDDMAEGRARGLGGHPYLQGLRHSFEGGLAHTDGGTPKQLGIQNPLAGLVKNYIEATEQYGRTGDPGYKPPPRMPLQSEQLAARFRDEPGAQRMIAAAQALETYDALENRGALLTVKLELRHTPEGALLGARIAESSGNRLFDAFVLKVVPASLGELPPPPPEVLRGKEELKTRWLVEGWHHPPKKLTQALTSSLASGQLLLPLDLLTGLDKEDVPGFEYRAKLIGLY